MTRFHSVMERPLSVSRVMPPTTTIVKTMAAMATRYFATSGVVRRISGGSGAGAVVAATVERFREEVKKMAWLGGRCRAVMKKPVEERMPRPCKSTYTRSATASRSGSLCRCSLAGCIRARPTPMVGSRCEGSGSWLAVRW